MSELLTIPELPGVGRLGRHVEHDDRSRAYVAAQAPALRSVLHRHHGAVLDQGQLGSCTGNAMAQLLNSTPHGPWERTHALLDEPAAVQLYSRATQLDGYPGTYPPDDTGSSGLAVAKAAQQAGMIASYAHAFGLDQALGALVLGPVITGVHWYEGFDRPDSHGRVKIAGSVRGGHEFLLLGLDVDLREVRALNSWSAAWGDHGRFTFSFDTWAQLLAEQGDVTTIGY